MKFTRAETGLISVGTLLHIVSMLAAVLIGGCSTTSGLQGEAGANTGFELEIYARKDQFSFARYRITRDGSIQYAGAEDAQRRNFTWTGSMLAEDQQQLRKLLDEHDWWNWQPARTAADDSPARYEVLLRDRTASHRFVVHGSPQRMTEVVELLERIAGARHESFLQTLPRPSVEVQQ